MDTFAFVIHPLDPKKDVSRKYPFLGRVLSAPQINFFSTFFPPIFISEVAGITSMATGKKVKGWLVACPFTSARMMELPEKIVYRKIIQTGRFAERLGAKILGLGATTAVVGDGGATVARALEIPVTTGSAYTVATAIEAVRAAAPMMKINMRNTTAAIVGATGTIGRVCASILADEVNDLILISRRQEALDALHQEIRATNQTANVHVSTDLQVLQNAQVILTMTNAVQAIIEPHQLPTGSVICDIAQPRDISSWVAAQRKDVLIIDGGIVTIPGPTNFNFDFGLPPGIGYACMAETIALALEGRFENFSIGKKITRAQVAEITEITKKHGFRLSGFRSFDRPVTDENIIAIHNKSRERIARHHRTPRPLPNAMGSAPIKE
jgi:predicted amino acid dehydrogenase